jgi:hypothetical protein
MNEFNIEKIANAIIFFIDRDVKHLGKTKFIKIMFIADKIHLEKYGRTIFEDTYYKTSNTIIPLKTFNIINDFIENAITKNSKTDILIKKFSALISMQYKYDKQCKQAITFTKKIDFNKNIFSKSELQILKLIAEQYRKTSSEEINNTIKNMEEFKNTPDYNIIEEVSMTENNKDYVSYWKKEISELSKI